MLPPRRLTTLLDQAIASQITRCPYHNLPRDVASNGLTLLVDHICNKYVTDVLFGWSIDLH